MAVELTDEEEKAIAALKRVAKKWPKTLWLFSANGTLNVMKTGEKGERVHEVGRCGGVNQDYIADTVNIPNSGGDW